MTLYTLPAPQTAYPACPRTAASGHRSPLGQSPGLCQWKQVPRFGLPRGGVGGPCRKQFPSVLSTSFHLPRLHFYPPSGWRLSGGLLGNARAAALSTQGTVLRVYPLQVRTGGGRLCARTKSVGLPSTCARPLPLHRIWPTFPLKQRNAGRKTENSSDNSRKKKEENPDLETELSSHLSERQTGGGWPLPW